MTATVAISAAVSVWSIVFLAVGMSYAGARRLAPKGMYPPEEPEQATEPPLSDRWEAHRWAWRTLCQAYLGRDELFLPERVRVRPPPPAPMRPPVDESQLARARSYNLAHSQIALGLSDGQLRRLARTGSIRGPIRNRPPPTPVPGAGRKVSM